MYIQTCTHGIHLGFIEGYLQHSGKFPKPNFGVQEPQIGDEGPPQLYTRSRKKGSMCPYKVLYITKQCVCQWLDITKKRYILLDID